jgi:hypothetical protein
MLRAEDDNVVGRKAKLQKLLITNLAEPLTNAPLCRVTVGMNKSAHEA